MQKSKSANKISLCVIEAETITKTRLVDVRLYAEDDIVGKGI